MGQAFYDYEGKRFMQVFLRDAETPFDYVQRPYRASGLRHEAVDILTDHLYCPGPSGPGPTPLVRNSCIGSTRTIMSMP